MNTDVYIKIAYWYYTLGLTQDEIAKRLSFTRQKVNQIINSLVGMNVVSINIHGYERDYVKLECALEERYSLKRAIVAADYGDEGAVIYKVANVAAQYLDETIQNGNIIGVSWGRTLAKVIGEMEYKKRSNCRVVQLIGAQNIEEEVEKSDEIVREMANKLDCPSYMLYAPVVVENPQTKQWLKEERSIKVIFDLMDKCDIAVLGIGELTQSATMCIRGHVSSKDIELLRSEGFVGDISMNPIRRDGSYDHCPISSRLLNADVECLKRIPNTVAVVCGKEKVEAIHAVLLSGCVDTLVIDETTARLALEQNEG